MSDRFQTVRLRRHGVRPLRFEGALLAQAGEEGEPQIKLYEIADGALALAVELPGCYIDAWRLESFDEVSEFISRFNPAERVGYDLTALIDENAEAAAQAAEIGGDAIGPAFRRVVNTLLRVSNNPMS